MAVSAVNKLQGTLNILNPSRWNGNDLGFFAIPDRKRVLPTTHVQGGRLVTYWIAPWTGVISEIRSVQQIAGGGAGGQNTIDVQVGPAGSLASVYAAAADGNSHLDNAAAATSQLNFPTATTGLGALTTCTDGQTRTKFNMGDVIYVVSAAGAGALGTVDIEITIERELPSTGA